jgi:hypothetical protein
LGTRSFIPDRKRRGSLLERSKMRSVPAEGNAAEVVETRNAEGDPVRVPAADVQDLRSRFSQLLDQDNGVPRDPGE